MTMGGWSDAFSFDRYAAGLARQAAMDPEGFALIQTIVLASLAGGALLSLGTMVFKRSGTATAGFALLVLTGLSQALLFGLLDFLTPDTKVLLGALTASALLVFTNAVLHTGRENVVIAGLSIVVIGILLALAGAVMLDKPYGAEARLAMLGSAALSGLLLLYAMIRDPKGKAILGIGVIIAVLSAALMTDEAVPYLRGVVPAAFPSLLITGGILLAALAAPFLADEHRIETRPRRHKEQPGYVPASLFGDEPDAPSNAGIFRSPDPQPVWTNEPATFDEPPQHEAPVFEAPQDLSPVPTFAAAAEQEAGFEAEEPAFHDEPSPFAAGAAADTASNHWREETGEVLEAAADEYVWDGLANPEVRCGEEVLSALGASQSSDLTPEGMRELIDAAVLPEFDEHVLGGSEPQSGPFTVDLETEKARFTLEGRRKVDHDGILLRIDAHLTDVSQKKTLPKAAPIDTGSLPSGTFRAISDLRSEEAAGIELAPGRALNGEEARAAILRAGTMLRAMIDGGRADAKLLVDGHGLGVRPGIVAAAVGKTIRENELPKGAVIVGLVMPLPREAKAFGKIAGDLHLAGADVAVILDNSRAKPIKNLDADGVWIGASKVTGRKAKKKNPLEEIERRFSLPVTVREVDTDDLASEVRLSGASYAGGSSFAGLFLPAGGNFTRTSDGGVSSKVGSLR
ncbi:hypothetical protein [Parvularcula maris]|uniref:hypothetical protein n=1 Tax=Parvularcula maris TaxID=2965077 RepID=UPI0021146BD4|nr:hypothetical protein [Parvularcula maris]